MATPDKFLEIVEGVRAGLSPDAFTMFAGTAGSLSVAAVASLDYYGQHRVVIAGTDPGTDKHAIHEARIDLRDVQKCDTPAMHMKWIPSAGRLTRGDSSRFRSMLARDRGCENQLSTQRKAKRPERNIVLEAISFDNFHPWPPYDVAEYRYKRTPKDEIPNFEQVDARLFGKLVLPFDAPIYDGMPWAVDTSGSLDYVPTT